MLQEFYPESESEESESPGYFLTSADRTEENKGWSTDELRYIRPLQKGKFFAYANRREKYKDGHDRTLLPTDWMVDTVEKMHSALKKVPDGSYEQKKRIVKEKGFDTIDCMTMNQDQEKELRRLLLTMVSHAADGIGKKRFERCKAPR